MLSTKKFSLIFFRVINKNSMYVCFSFDYFKEREKKNAFSNESMKNKKQSTNSVRMTTYKFISSINLSITIVSASSDWCSGFILFFTVEQQRKKHWNLRNIFLTFCFCYCFHIIEQYMWKIVFIKKKCNKHKEKKTEWYWHL